MCINIDYWNFYITSYLSVCLKRILHIIQVIEINTSVSMFECHLHMRNSLDRTHLVVAQVRCFLTGPKGRKSLDPVLLTRHVTSQVLRPGGNGPPSPESQGRSQWFPSLVLLKKHLAGKRFRLWREGNCHLPDTGTWHRFLLHRDSSSSTTAGTNASV